MLFNSLQFFQFFALLYIIYISVSHKWQNRLLLVGSYFFYGCWDWRFLSLILISTVIDYFAGLKITTSQNKRHRKLFVSISVVSNLAILGIFKYFDFFASSLQSMLAWGCGIDCRLCVQKDIWWRWMMFLAGEWRRVVDDWLFMDW